MIDQIIQSVVVKSLDISFSGTLVVGRFILITSHLINSIKSNQIENNFWVITKSKESDIYTTREAFLIGSLCNNNIKTILRRCFSDIYDYNESKNKETVQNIVELFTIHVLSFDRNAKVDEFRKLWKLQEINFALTTQNHSCKQIKEQNNNSLSFEVKIAEEIYIKAAPFGSKHLMNSYSQGIVSNCVGGVLLMDCPSVVGCEGGVVVKKLNNVPVGLVISSMAGWRGEWTGLTLAITFDAILSDQEENFKLKLNDSISSLSATSGIKKSILDNITSSLVYVQCDSSWGTGICIDKKLRLLLTNSHVITNPDNINIVSGKASTRATVVFKSPDGLQFDLAVLQCEDLTSFQSLRNVCFAKERLNVGDAVFILGYPIFGHYTGLPPTITQGHVSLVKDGVVMTTCTVLPGASGGALCDSKGRLAGIVTCNIINIADGNSYPRVNMSIPIQRIEQILLRFMRSGDKSILNKLILDDDQNSGWAVSKL